MGIESRQYFRDESRYSEIGSPNTPVCKYILIVTVAVFLVQVFGNNVTPWLAMQTELVLHGQVWRLLTAAFCHSEHSLFHIVLNMLCLWWFGRTLETMLGSREFLLFYLAGAIFASLVQLVLDLFIAGPGAFGIGASGAIMGVIMLFAIYNPRATIYLFMVIPVQARFAVMLFALIDLVPVLSALSGRQLNTGIGHAAHLGGLAFGFLYYRMSLRLERWLPGFSGKRFRQMTGPGRKLKIYQPEAKEASPEDLSLRVDEILRKINDYGQDSLTEKERRILEQASQQYRNRES